MCHENKMGAAKEQHPYINQVDIVGGTGWNRGWNRVEQWNSSGTSGTVTRPLFKTIWSDTTYCNGIISFLYIILGAKKPAAKAARYHLLPFF